MAILLLQVKWALRPAVIGLVRNLCANDEIKSTLLRRSSVDRQELIAIMNSTFRDKTGVFSRIAAGHACVRLLPWLNLRNAYL
jgi:hypothetical protein